MLRALTTSLIANGKIVTTEARAKEVRKQAEKLIALAVREKDNYEEVTVYDEIEKTIKKDKPSRLHARRQMLAYLYPVTEVPAAKAGQKKNTKSVDLAAKLFDEYGAKYATRNGGYTRIVKIGLRKGDAAMEVLLELV